MCESLGYKVKSLKRVRIMNIRLDLPTGKYRELTKEELYKMNLLLENLQNLGLIKIHYLKFIWS